MKHINEIIAGCLEGNHKDQKCLYERYYGYCLRVVFRYIFLHDKAIDVVQDGFVKIFGKLHGFCYDETLNPEMLLMGWMRTIMIHTAIDRLRKDNFLPEIGILNENAWLIDRSGSADQSLLYKELVSEIKKLPPGYRAVFNMYVIDGFTHQQIADQLKISVGTSKSNLSKARVLVQKFIKASNDETLKYATGK